MLERFHLFNKWHASMFATRALQTIRSYDVCFMCVFPLRHLQTYKLNFVN